MAPPAPVPPAVFKRMLELYGYTPEGEDAHTWYLGKRDEPMPLIMLPKAGDLLSLQLMMPILDALSISDGVFFHLRDQAMQ